MSEELRRERREGLTRSLLCRGPSFLQRGSLRLKEREGKFYLPKNGTATRVTCAYLRETNVGDARGLPAGISLLLADTQS